MRLVWGVVTSFAALGLVACVDDDPTAAPASSCAALVDDAAMEAEITDQVAILDRALAACRSFDQLAGELERHPSLLGFDVETYVVGRCTTPEVGDLADSTICTATVTTTTLPPAPTTTLPVYLGQTLDGRQVEIRPDADTEFVDGLPAPIVLIVDIADEDGCDGVRGERDRWSIFAEDPVIGDEASVYAQHAINVLAVYGCD